MNTETSGANNSCPTTVEELKNELDSVKAELQSVKQEFHNYRNAVSKKFSGHEEELTELEARFEEETPTPDESKTGSQDSELLPIERIARLKESDDESGNNPFADTTPSVDRAVAIYQHFREWSDKAPKGRVIRSGLKKLLETVTGENLYWSQVKRACRKLEEFSKGSISFKKTSRHGNILVAENQSVLAATG